MGDFNELYFNFKNYKVENVRHRICNFSVRAVV